MTTTTATQERYDYREMYCGECEEYVTTVLVNDETEECPTHGDDCNLFETKSEWVDALRSDHEEMMWQADREEF